MNKKEWHEWFAWHPVYSFELGWVWLCIVNRKEIPKDYSDHQRPKRFTKFVVYLLRKLSERVTGCWHRIPEDW